MERSEAELIAAVLQGDAASFEPLVQKYSPRVFATARRYARRESEVEDIAEGFSLKKEPTIQRWARNRHDVLAGPDGLFTAADWYPKLGGSARNIGDNLAAFYRLVELRSITRRPS